jgi:menaquinone-dependent protoporphyrinogen oxidase
VRVLVAWASKHGSTREIAEVIAETLAAAGLDAEAREARGVRDLSGYDAVILGSALYAAHWRRDANRFVARHLASLQERPVWLFSSGPLDRSAEAGSLPVPPSIEATTAPIGARDHRTFGGRLLPDTPGVDSRILATHPLGDFRNWDAIRAWAVGIAAALRELPPPT